MLLCYVQQSFASFRLCVLQDSGVTPLKCAEIHYMDFVANFMENTVVKKILKIGQHFSKL